MQRRLLSLLFVMALLVPIAPTHAQPGAGTPLLGQTVGPPPYKPNDVWVNTPSKVYYCPNDKLYGQVKPGVYMPEAQAKSQGNRGSNGRNCGG